MTQGVCDFHEQAGQRLASNKLIFNRDLTFLEVLKSWIQMQLTQFGTEKCILTNIFTSKVQHFVPKGK